MGAVELPGHGFPCKIRDMGAPRDSDPPNLAVHVPQQDTIVSLDGCVPRRISCTPVLKLRHTGLRDGPGRTIRQWPVCRAAFLIDYHSTLRYGPLPDVPAGTICWRAILCVNWVPESEGQRT